MGLIDATARQFSENLKLYVWVLAVPAVIMAGTWVFGNALGLKDMGYLTRDPNTILKGHVYTGMISNLGIFLWSASATVCLITAGLLHKMKNNSSGKILMLFAGLLALLMGLDDAFQMHEKMFNDIIYIPEYLFFVFYGVCVFVIAILSYRVFIKTDFTLWCLALLMFFISLVIDIYGSAIQHHKAFWEDSFKFAGICIWLVYYLRTSTSFIIDLKKENPAL